MVIVVYREAFFRFDLGAAAALSVVLLVVLVVLNASQLRLLGRPPQERDATQTAPATPRSAGVYAHVRGARRAVPVPDAVERCSSLHGRRERPGDARARATTGAGTTARALRLPDQHRGRRALTVAVTVVVTTLGGYAVRPVHFPGKNLLFLVTLAILMVPVRTILIPLYVLLD